MQKEKQSLRYKHLGSCFWKFPKSPRNLDSGTFLLASKQKVTCIGVLSRFLPARLDRKFGDASNIPRCSLNNRGVSAKVTVRLSPFWKVGQVTILKREGKARDILSKCADERVNLDGRTHVLLAIRDILLSPSRPLFLWWPGGGSHKEIGGHKSCRCCEHIAQSHHTDLGNPQMIHSVYNVV